jgi:hypothetical protein
MLILFLRWPQGRLCGCGRLDTIIKCAKFKAKLEQMAGFVCSTLRRRGGYLMTVNMRQTKNKIVFQKASHSRMAAVCLAMLLSACATVGRDFSASKVYDIQIGKTTQAEIHAMFGQPWRVGIEDGKPTWTYGSYHYSAFSEARTKDIVIRFDANNIVRSYTFNTSNPADIRKP